MWCLVEFVPMFSWFLECSGPNVSKSVNLFGLKELLLLFFACGFPLVGLNPIWICNDRHVLEQGPGLHGNFWENVRFSTFNVPRNESSVKKSSRTIILNWFFIFCFCFSLFIIIALRVYPELKRLTVYCQLYVNAPNDWQQHEYKLTECKNYTDVSTQTLLFTNRNTTANLNPRAWKFDVSNEIFALPGIFEMQNFVRTYSIWMPTCLSGFAGTAHCAFASIRGNSLFKRLHISRKSNVKFPILSTV